MRTLTIRSLELSAMEKYPRDELFVFVLIQKRQSFDDFNGCGIGNFCASKKDASKIDELHACTIQRNVLSQSAS